MVREFLICGSILDYLLPMTFVGCVDKKNSNDMTLEVDVWLVYVNSAKFEVRSSQDEKIAG